MALSSLPNRYFPPILTHENGLVSQDEVLFQLNISLSELLKANDKDFWQVVQSNSSLRKALDAFLRFKRRPFDQTYSADASGDCSKVEEEVSRRVFRTLSRMVTSGGSITSRQQAKIIYDSWLLDVPKFLDLAAIYGVLYKSETEELIARALNLAPRYLTDIHNVVPGIVDSITDVTAECGAAVGEGRDLATVWDYLCYLQDACLSLLAFVDCCWPASKVILEASDGDLLAALCEVSCRLLPAVRTSVLAGRDDERDCHVSRTTVGVTTVKMQYYVARLVAQLFRHAFLEPPSATYERFGEAQEAGGVSSSRTGPSSTATTSSRDSRNRDPEQLGYELVEAISAASNSYDNLSEGSAPLGGGGASAATQPLAASLLYQVDELFDLEGQIRTAAQTGIVSLDDTQLTYVMTLVRNPAKVALSVAQSAPSPLAAAAAGDGVYTLSGGLSTAGPVQDGVDSGVLASLISQVKDILPELGDGFVKACLYAIGFSAEEVINRLLEESLPPSVQVLSRTLTTWCPPSAAPPKHAPSMTAPLAPFGEQSKRLDTCSVTEFPELSRPGFKPRSGIQGSSSASLAAAAVGAPSSTSWSNLLSPKGANMDLYPAPGSGSGSRVPVPSTVDRRTASILNRGRADDSLRKVINRLGEEMLWEYDDEYDDSFDDLVATADGVTDVEGEDLMGRHGSAATSGSSEKPGPRLRHGSSTADTADLSAASSRFSAAAATAAAAVAAKRAEASTTAGRHSSAADSSRDDSRRRSGPAKPKLWVLNGRIYNFAKEGARPALSQEEADRLMEEERLAAEEIHGLGRNGNRALWHAAPKKDHDQDPDMDQGEDGETLTDGGAGHGPRAVPSGGGGRGTGGRGFGNKERHKASVGNHHRKDRALRKQGVP